MFRVLTPETGRQRLTFRRGTGIGRTGPMFVCLCVCLFARCLFSCFSCFPNNYHHYSHACSQQSTLHPQGNGKWLLNFLPSGCLVNIASRTYTRQDNHSMFDCLYPTAVSFFCFGFLSLITYSKTKPTLAKLCVLNYGWRLAAVK